MNIEKSLNRVSLLRRNIPPRSAPFYVGKQQSINFSGAQQQTISSKIKFSVMAARQRAFPDPAAEQQNSIGD